MREGADRARQLADADDRARAAHALDVARRSPRTRAPASGRTSSARRARRACGRSSACGGARSRASRIASRQRRRGPSRIRSHASRICSACAVSMTSDEVRPKCSQRADGPTCSATAVVNAMTSCWVICFDLLDARDVEARRARGCRARRRPGRCRPPPSPRPPRSRRAARSRSDAGRSRSAPSRGGCSAESSHRDRLSSQVEPSRAESASRSTLPSTVAASDAVREQIAPPRAARRPRVTRSMPCERLVEAELPVEVDLLPRQVRHAARGVLEAQHQAALQVILRALQLRVRHRRAA